MHSFSIFLFVVFFRDQTGSTAFHYQIGPMKTGRNKTELMLELRTSIQYTVFFLISATGSNAFSSNCTIGHKSRNNILGCKIVNIFFLYFLSF